MHAQTRRGLLLALAFVVAAAVAGAARSGDDWWPALHLFVVGGLLSAISAVAQMLAVTWSAAPPPRPSVAAAQRWALAAGAVGLVWGREAGARWLFVAGGTAVVAAVLALAALLWHVRQHAVTDRFAPAVEAYSAAIVAGAVGMSSGIVLGGGYAEGSASELRGAHLVLNLFGLVGLVIAGTLPYFSATMVRAKMARYATPTAIRATVGSLFAATAVAALGRAVDVPGVASAGLIAYVAGLLSIGAMLPVFSRRRFAWAGPRLWQLLSGIAWWAAMTVALAVSTVRATDDRPILQALVIGGFAQILVASLAYLGPVLLSPGPGQLDAGFAITRSWPSLLVGNVAGAAVLAGHRPTFVVAVVVWGIDLVTRFVRLLRRSAAGRVGRAGRERPYGRRLRAFVTALPTLTRPKP